MTLLTCIILFFLGAIIASFTGVVVEHVHTGSSWIKGRSRCNSCRATLGPLDLIPVFSWVFSLGRCRHCGSKVPSLYLFIEALLGALFAYSYLTLGLTLVLPFFLAALAVILFVVLYDMRHTVVPAGSSSLLLAICLAVAVLSAASPMALGATLLQAGVISLGFFLLYALSRGRAMGLGDAPIALALSLLVGSRAFPGLLFSFWIGALFGIAVLSTRRGGPTMGIEIPFVPFLAVGYLLAFFTTWNPLMLAW